MKILIFGLSGSGKTTLAESINTYLDVIRYVNNMMIGIFLLRDVLDKPTALDYMLWEMRCI